MIRAAFKEWKDLSDRLLALSFPTDDLERDAIIQTIEQILDSRDDLEKEMQPPFTAEEEVFGRELLTQEPKVVEKLEHYLTTIRKDLSASQTKKESMRGYINPYNKVARDGTFYDTKQ